MKNKKFASLILAGTLVVTMGTSAFAVTTVTPFCAVTNCTQTGNHQHRGTTYAAHKAGDGHNYHNGSHDGGSHKSGGHHG